MGIKTKKFRQGKYVVSRDDGRSFVVLRATREWVIQAQDTLAVGGAQTLRAALYDIRDGWTKGLTK